MRIILLRCIGALTALMMASGAWGASVTWTLSNALFDDGATAFGSFVYNTGSNTYSSIDITVLGFDLSGAPVGWGWGLEADPFHYIVDGQKPPTTSLRFSFFDYASAPASLCPAPGTTCTREFEWHFESPLTSCAPTSTCFLPISSFTHEKFTRDGIVGDTRHRLISGQVQSTAVPIPAAAWLFGSGLAMLGWIRRRKAA